MNYILAAVMAFTLVSGVSFAETEKTPKKQDNLEAVDKDPRFDHRQRRQSRIYSRTFKSVIMRSLELVSEEPQKEELMQIRDKYLGPIVDKQKELQMANRQVMQSVTNADFTDAEVKKEFEKSQALRAEMFNLYLSGLSDVKKVVGDENYNKLFPKTWTTRSKQKPGGKDKKAVQEAPKPKEKDSKSE